LYRFDIGDRPLLDFAILGLLLENPQHGYELKRALGELGFWQVSFGSLYPALRRLEKRGYIEAQRGSGRRKAYRITASGMESFEDIVTQIPDPDENERSFQLRLAFLGSLPPERRISVLEGRRAALSTQLQGDRRTFLGARRSKGDRYRLALMERRVLATESDIAWLDELIAGERSAAAGA
jgi:DNA-binding PadR family transcriptional regulator